MRRLGGDGKDKTGKRTPGQQVKPGVTKEYQEEEKMKKKESVSKGKMLEMESGENRGRWESRGMNKRKEYLKRGKQRNENRRL